MSTNYENNKDKIIEDYYKCIGAFKNCFILYNAYIDPNKEINNPMVLKGMKEDLLSNLGKVGEKAFKYIYSLEILRTYPNIDSQSFEAFFKKESALKDFAERHGIDKNDEGMDRLMHYDDINKQKAHNFDYWYSVISITMSEYENKLKKYNEYKSQSEMLIEYCKKENDFKMQLFTEEFSLPFIASMFPEILEMEYETIPSLTLKQLEMIKDTKRKVIKESGDIFTRLRYASNNPDKKEFNLDEVYSIISDLVSFIEMIHGNKDNLEFNLDESYARIRAIELKNILERNTDEINDIFDLDLDASTLETIFTCGYPYDKIIKFLQFGVSKDKLIEAWNEGLQPYSIKYFNSIGITNFHEMREIIDKYIEEGFVKNK